VICVSVREKSLKATMRALRGLEFAEVRLDGFFPTAADAAEIFSSHPCLIATLRPGSLPEPERNEVLLAAVAAGAAYLDIELESSPAFREPLIRAARGRGCRVIVSHHDFRGTPGPEELASLVEGCFSAGADLAKIACLVNAPAEAARLLGLLDDPRMIVPVGMGEPGRITRVAAPLLGAPFTFASPAVGRETAEGQFEASRLKKILSEISGGPA